MQHYLSPLVEPDSVALVGASERPGSVGRIVYENLLAGGYAGRLYAVNPGHRTVLGCEAYPSLAAIGAPVDLAVIATPPHAVADTLASAAGAPPKIAVVMTAANGMAAAAARAWSRDIVSVAKRHRIRIVGPGALGVIRPDAHLNATYCAPSALPGRLALIAQSGAVATAMLDFATPLGIGFSTVVSLGGAIDVGFGELLDLLLLDPVTEGILLHLEDVGDARAFVSALRAAARTKPVVVLKTGRSLDPAVDITPDAVLAAALMRAGTVRVQTYTQLFAAARILARGRIPQGDRLAIVSNGRGPAVLASDAAMDRGLRLASFTSETAGKLEVLLPGDSARHNPVDVQSDGSSERLAGAVRAVLDDPNVDAVVALHVPRPIIPPLQAAAALADVAKTSSKPVLAAWMGAVDRQEVHAALESGSVSNFFTPENAVDALSFLVAYRDNQEWLLEVPPPQPEPEPLDLAEVEALRIALADAKRNMLTSAETFAVLAAFGLGRYAVVETPAEALRAADDIRFPLFVELDAFANAGTQRVVRMRRSLHKALTELQRIARRSPPPGWTQRFVLRAAPRSLNAKGLAIGVVTDRRFGPVIYLRPGAATHPLVQRRTLLLPPLNARLAADSIAQAAGDHAVDRLDPAAVDALIGVLIRISALVCALPWVVRAEFDVLIDAAAFIVGARIEADPRRKLLRGYPHMAIHPYPVELIGDVTLPDGTPLQIRPIRPEDAVLERAFVDGLSEQTRYFRFFYRIAELTPAMLMRFTQVDYDRELALVALTIAEDGNAQSFVGVARYVANPDRTSAEFALVVADAWQRRGVGKVLMRGLIVCARRRGLERLTGTILRANEAMLEFVRPFGFSLDSDPDDPAQVCATLALERTAESR
jgi:acetyltransferase